MRAVLVDDEKYCTDVLEILIQKHCPNVEIIATFNRAEEAVNFIKSTDLDLIFLDIEMPIMNGFDLIDAIQKPNLKIIFTTAYDQYAIKAFKFNALEYLLKPIDKNDLIAAVQKVNTAISPSIQKIEYAQYLSQNPIPERILLPIGQEIIFVNVDTIICCEGQGSYANIYCTDQNKPYLLSKNLREMEDLLNNPSFFRSHASWLVNDKHIKKIIKGEGMEIVMSNDIHIPVSRLKRQEVLGRYQV
jgi:two-component system LytT family response regulator